jgi:hypothetical protein
MRHYDPEIKALSSLYDLLAVVVDGFPEKEYNAYSKKDREKISKNLVSFSSQNDKLLSSVTKDIINPSPEMQFDRLRDIVKLANTKHMESQAARYEEWIAFAKRFDEPTQKALTRFIEYGLIDDTIITKDNMTGEVYFAIDSNYAFYQRVYLKNAVISDNFKEDVYEEEDAEIDVQDGGYRLSFVQASEIVTVDFPEVCLETQLLNYSANSMWDGSPWHRIRESLTALGIKKDLLGMKYLNKKERALWRLSAFSPLLSMDSSYQSVSGDKKADEIFCRYAERAGNERMALLTKQYTETVFKEKEKARIALVKELHSPASEALMRLMLAEIKNAAADYPLKVELDVEPAMLAQTRKTITNIMRQNNYEGEYPHFKKMSSLKGIRLLEIQGQPITVINEKHMACLVDCFEHSINSSMLVPHFAASTVFLKTNELDRYEALDGYSGFFPHRYRRRARSLSPNLDFRYDGELTYDLEGITLAAAKTAECEKLTKEERRKIVSVGPGLFGCLFYGGLFLLVGVAFGLLFCPAMFLVALLLGAPVTAFSPQAPSFAEYSRDLLFDFPWWQMFLFCVVGFGLPMTVVTAISKRRG